MTPRLTKLLIATGILTIFAAAWVWVIMPQVFPSTACVYEADNGEIVEGWGNGCSEKPGAIVLTVD